MQRSLGNESKMMNIHPVTSVPQLQHVEITSGFSRAMRKKLVCFFHKRLNNFCPFFYRSRNVAIYRIFLNENALGKR